MSGNVQITGVPTTPGANGSVPPRREIRDLQANFPDQFNLLVLGMRAYQGIDEKQLTSYYQVAGIHGEPFKAWDGVEGIDDWQFGGYCTHSSVLFAPWHRPYLALFEQSLYASIQAIAKQFPTSVRDRYVQAAKDVRLPYYDWAANAPSGSANFPTSLSAAKISVVDVDGKSKQIDNPFYQYSFHPVNPAPGDFDEQWSQYGTTVRYPDRSGKSRDAMVSQVLANEHASLQKNVSLILLSYHDFDGFSNNAWRGSSQPGSFGSLEDIHNEIHDKTGGNGHMAALEVAAFDPLFWFHHCNVDRLWAIWQDMNPTSYITPKEAQVSTFSTEAGTIESAESALTPFWDASGKNFWAASQVKTTTGFGYCYPETQPWNFANASAYQQGLKQAVVKLYGGNALSSFVRNLAVQAPSGAGMAAGSVSLMAQPAALPADAVPAVAAEKKTEPAVEVAAVPADKDSSKQPSTSEGPIPKELAHLAPNGKYTEWIVNVRCRKHVLGQTYRVLVFLGPINPDPTTWDLEYNCVGRVTVLGRSAATSCGKCRRDQADDLRVTGTVPLTSALLQDIVSGSPGVPRDLTPEQVVPYLTEKLSWRVTLFDGEEKPVAEVPGLHVSVASTEVTIGADGMPHFSGNYTVHREITAGKAGGVGHHDEI